MLRFVPNALTCLRLLLALPLGYALMRQEYALALSIGVLAGLSDAVDGYLARRLNVTSRFGAVLDPIADKILITTLFLCFALTNLVPWYLSAVVIGRDIVIVCGAISYNALVGPVEFAATWLSKANMLVQIIFCSLLILAQIVAGVSGTALTIAASLVILFALASGIDYVITWTKKALNARNRGV